MRPKQRTAQIQRDEGDSIAGIVQHQNAITENPLAGQAGFGYYNRQGGRIAVRWEPIDGLTNDMSFDIAKDENTPFYSQLLNYNPNLCAATTAAQPLSAGVIPGAQLCYRVSNQVCRGWLATNHVVLEYRAI